MTILQYSCINFYKTISMSSQIQISMEQIPNQNSQSPKEKKRRKIWLQLELAGLTAVIVIIAALMLLPVVFFYLPRVT